MSSLQDKIELAKLNASKKLHDNNVKILGTEIKLLRIYEVENKYQDVETSVINNETITAIVSFPVDIDLARYRLGSTSNITSQAVSLFDLLPIEVFTRNFNSNDSTINRNDLEQGDFLLYVIEDVNTLIPILFRVSASFGTLRKSLIFKKFNMAPYSGEISTAVQTIIDDYLDNYEF